MAEKTALPAAEQAEPKKKRSLFSLDLNTLLGRKPKAHIRLSDLVLFTRQLTTMISAGIPILESIDVLRDQAEDPGFREDLTQIGSDVRAGTDFSEALGRHPDVFSRLYINMIRAGEASGQLDVILSRLAEYMEATAALRRRIRSAMTYPVVSLALITLITLFLMLVIIPQFKDIFVSLLGDSEKLPMPTKVVLGISEILRTQTLKVLLGTIVLGIIFYFWKNSKQGAYAWDKLKLKVPVFGPLFQKVAISRFARTFATLLSSGVPILGALEIVAATAGNRVVERAVLKARDAIREGEPLAAPLGESKIFPMMVVRMIDIGERSGALDQLLEKVSDFYDEMVNATVEALTSLIEPLMIAVMGLMVGGIVLSVFWPIIELPKLMKQGAA